MIVVRQDKENPNSNYYYLCSHTLDQ